MFFELKKSMTLSFAFELWYIEKAQEVLSGITTFQYSESFFSKSVELIFCTNVQTYGLFGDKKNPLKINDFLRCIGVLMDSKRRKMQIVEFCLIFQTPISSSQRA